MKKIIPPVLFLMCVAIMIALRFMIVLWIIFRDPFNYFGIIAVVLGIAMTIKVRRQFAKMDTEIHTFKTPIKLITEGMFKTSRNPIYLGFTISLIGIWVVLGSALPLIGCILFFLISHFYYIPTEEKIMEQTFGRDYLKYKSKVRRWL